MVSGCDLNCGQEKIDQPVGINLDTYPMKPGGLGEQLGALCLRSIDCDLYLSGRGTEKIGGGQGKDSNIMQTTSVHAVKSCIDGAVETP